MKLLVLCDEGNNRSVTLGTQLKYLGHDVLTAGLRRNDLSTIIMLYQWADKVILTAESQRQILTLTDKVDVWHIGEDIYPRPFNKELLSLSRRLIEEHPEIKEKL